MDGIWTVVRILSLSALDFTSESARNRPRQIAKHGVASRRNASETGSSQIQFPDSARRRIFPVFAVSGKVREARKASGPLRSSRPQAQPPFNRVSCAREKSTADCFTRRTSRSHVPCSFKSL